MKRKSNSTTLIDQLTIPSKKPCKSEEKLTETEQKYQEKVLEKSGKYSFLMIDSLSKTLISTRAYQAI